jgi:hypothetical protein
MSAPTVTPSARPDARAGLLRRRPAAGAGGGRRRRSAERIVFTAATFGALAHALDDALVHRGSGLGIGEFAPAAALALGAAIGGALAFPPCARASRRRSPSPSASWRA